MGFWRTTRSSLGNRAGSIRDVPQRYPVKEEGRAWRWCQKITNGSENYVFKDNPVTPTSPHPNTGSCYSLWLGCICFGWLLYLLEEIGSDIYQWAVSLPVSSDGKHSHSHHNDDISIAYLCLVYLRPLKSLRHVRRGEGPQHSYLVDPSWRQAISNGNNGINS